MSTNARWMAIAILALGVIAAPAPRSARALDAGPTIATLDLAPSEDGYDVVLRGTGRLGAERIRTRPGLLRVWLSGFEDAVHLDARGDGVRVRRVQVRPGVDETVLVSVELGGDAKVRPSDVSIERGDGTTRIRLAASALPVAPPPVEAAEPPSRSGGDVPAPTQPAALADGPISSPETPERSPASALAGTPADAEATQTPTGAAAAPPHDDGTDASAGGASAANPFPWENDEPVADEDAAGEDLALGSTDAGATTGTLVLVSLFLGLVYLGVRLLQNRNIAVPGADPTIALVATRRLGPKHQLVVVRAMGRDHLLSVQGNATKRLASTRSPDPDDFEASFGIPEGPVDLEPPGRSFAPEPEPIASHPAPDERDDAGDSARHAISSLRYPVTSSRPSLAARRSGTVPRSDAADLESRFGANLFDYAVKAQRLATDGDDSEVDATESSESIAGLLRLRARRRAAG